MLAMVIVIIIVVVIGGGLVYEISQIGKELERK